MPKGPTRILVDAHVFDGEFQGTRTFIQGIYSVLAGKDDIEIYLAANNIEQLKKDFPSRPNVFFLSFKSNSGMARLSYEIPSLVRKYRIDFAHFQYIVPLVKNCRFIVTTHDVIFNEYPEEFSSSYRRTKNLLYRLSALRSDILTTVSGYSKRSIRKYLGIKKKPILITPNGVADRFFVEHNKEESRNYIRQQYGIGKFILYVSRIEPRKNHALLLKAFLDLQLYAKGYYLVLLGHESIKVPDFDSLLASLPEAAKDKLILRRDVNDEDLLQFYRAADLFVYPSKAEGFGIPPLEAAALKTPVLCSNTSAMSDFNFFGKDQFDPYNEGEFKEKLINALENPHNPSYLEQLSRQIREKYSWEASAQKLYEIIVK
jgi:glycosyltransferase involved in cell wall biosynthesis